MATIASTPPRRSGRAFHKMRLQAKGRAHDGRKFRETCETVVVNAHGALLLLKHEIDNGETLVLIHPETLEEHTSQLQSPDHLVCRLLLKKKQLHNYRTSERPAP